MRVEDVDVDVGNAARRFPLTMEKRAYVQPWETMFLIMVIRVLPTKLE